MNVRIFSQRTKECCNSCVRACRTPAVESRGNRFLTVCINAMAQCVPLSMALRSRVEEAKVTGWLSLSGLGLRAIPPPVFELGAVIRRLELNDNMIEAVPDGIGKLVNL